MANACMGEWIAYRGKADKFWVYCQLGRSAALFVAGHCQPKHTAVMRKNNKCSVNQTRLSLITRSMNTHQPSGPGYASIIIVSRHMLCITIPLIALPSLPTYSKVLLHCWHLTQMQTLRQELATSAHIGNVP